MRRLIPAAIKVETRGCTDTSNSHGMHLEGEEKIILKKMKKPVGWNGKRNAAFAAIAIVAVSVAACGSAPGNSTGAAPAPAQLSADVPTLEQLYAGTATAPPASSPPIAKNKSVWIITCASSAAGCLVNAEASVEAAQFLGWETKLIDGQYNAGGAWSKAIEQATAAKPDAIMLTGMDCANVQQPLQRAKDAGIELINVNGSDCETPLMTTQVKFSDEIATWEDWDYQLGAFSANYIARKSEGSAKVLTSQNKTEAAPKLQSEGFAETLTKNCPSCKIIDNFVYTSVDFAPNGAWIQAIRSQLSKYGSQADAVYMPWDVEISLGGPQAIQQAGLSGSTELFGFQGTPVSVEALRSGQIDALTWMPFEWIGYAAIDELNRAFNGQEPVSQGLGFQIVDKDHGLPASGDLKSSVDWKSAYQKTWKAAGAS